MTIPRVRQPGRISRLIEKVAYGASAVILFSVVHLTADKIDRLARKASRLPVSEFFLQLVDAVHDHAPAIKTVAFVCALLITGWPILKFLAVTIPGPGRFARLARVLIVAGGVAVAVGVLAFRPGTDSMGTNYALLARDPFAQSTSSHSTRLLMPALAYIFHLRDFQPYYLFTVFLTVAFIALLYLWTEDHAPLRTWQLISLCTCSFVIFQYQYGGYPDILVFLFFILIMQKNISQEARLSLLILALLTHESSLFVGSILAWRYLDRKNLIGYLLLAFAYGTIWLWLSGWDIQAIAGKHSVGGKSGLEWLAASRAQELLGVLVSYKAVWLAIAAALWISVREKLFTDAVFIAACLGAGIFMTTLGVDTSRLMGFAFPGALAAIAVVANRAKSRSPTNLLSVILLLNLLAPSFYIGLNGWIEFFPGVYNLLYGWIAST